MYNLTPSQIQAANHKLDKLLIKANSAIPGLYLKKPLLIFNVRGTCAGKAYPNKWTIALNPTLYAENEEEFLRQIIGHELAHLIAFKCFGEKIAPHGKEWKTIMQKIGLLPHVRHTLNVENAICSKQIFKYSCACATPHLFTKKKHQNNKSYVCKKCGAYLTYTGFLKEKGIWKQDLNKKTTQNAHAVAAKGVAAPLASNKATPAQLTLLKTLMQQGKLPLLPLKNVSNQYAKYLLSQVVIID